MKLIIQKTRKESTSLSSKMESETDCNIESGEKQVESCGKSRKYPKSVIFILSNIFLDRFSNGGILGEFNINMQKYIIE